VALSCIDSLAEYKEEKMVVAVVVVEEQRCHPWNGSFCPWSSSSLHDDESVLVVETVQRQW